MSNINISFNTIISKAMHRPISKDGDILYPKLDSYKGEVEGNSTAEQKQSYRIASEHNYNSPTNIRKLFITGKNVAVQYYAAPKMQKNNGLYYIKKSLSNNIFEVVSKILTYNSDKSRYMMEKTINTKAVEPDNYKVTGSVIGVISKPYTCNNIEEIYMDWTFLASQEAGIYFPELYNSDTIQVLLNKQTKFTEMINDKMEKYFCEFNTGGVKDIRTRFPRLKAIGMISDLDDILEHPSMVILDRRFNNIEEQKSTWYAANRELIKQSQSIVLLSDLSKGIPRLNNNFKVKNTQYKYDKFVLEPLVEAYKKKLNEYELQKTYGASKNSQQVEDEQEENTGIQITDEEKFIEDILNNQGEAVLKKVLLVAVNGLTASQIKDILIQFTKKNRTKVASLIGLKL